MNFYSLSKEERTALIGRISQALSKGIEENSTRAFRIFYSDPDTYIRKAAYLATGKLSSYTTENQIKIIQLLKDLWETDDEKVRQTVINAAGEIGMKDFSLVEDFFERGLEDEHHQVRNAVIGSMKKMSEKNPVPVLAFAHKFLHHPDKEIRREICHGIELRGRTHPEDILPLLKELQFDNTARVRNTLIHVLGQIAYKKGCLEKVVLNLRTWENTELAKEALKEIIEVHHRYKDFAVKTATEAEAYILENF